MGVEKKPGAISTDQTAGNVLQRMREDEDEEQTISLGGKGEAGTGTVTVPEGTPTQQRKYAKAVHLRKYPDLAEKLDAQKREVQKSFSFDSSKPGAGLVYQSKEEDKDKEAFRKFFEEADEQTPVHDEPLSEEDKAANVAIEKEDRAEKWKKAAGQAVERGKKQPKRQKPAGGDEEDEGTNGGGDPVKTSGAADVNAELYAPHLEGSEDMTPEQLIQKAFDAAAKNYGQSYEDRQPYTEEGVEIDGIPYSKETYESGEVFLVPTGEEGDLMRAHDDKAQREKFKANKAKMEAFGL